MVKIVYIGGFDEVFVPTGLHEGLVVKRGEATEIPDLLADGLLEQTANWTAAEEAPKAPAEEAPKQAVKAAKKDGD